MVVRAGSQWQRLQPPQSLAPLKAGASGLKRGRGSEFRLRDLPPLEQLPHSIAVATASWSPCPHSGHSVTNPPRHSLASTRAVQWSRGPARCLRTSCPPSGRPCPWTSSCRRALFLPRSVGVGDPLFLLFCPPPPPPYPPPSSTPVHSTTFQRLSILAGRASPAQ